MYYVDDGTTPVATVNIHKHRKRLLFNTVQVPLTLLVGTPPFDPEVPDRLCKHQLDHFQQRSMNLQPILPLLDLVRVVPTPSPLQCLVVPAGYIIAFFCGNLPSHHAGIIRASSWCWWNSRSLLLKICDS